MIRRCAASCAGHASPAWASLPRCAAKHVQRQLSQPPLWLPPLAQVKHFDEQQLQQARAAKNVHAAINQQAVRAAGTLAGKS